MTRYEILALGISLISAFIAIVSLVRTRKLEKIMAELAQKQISQLDDAKRDKTLPKLHVEFSNIGTSYRFHIINRGEGIAYNVNIEMIDCPKSPLLQNDLDEKFPFLALHPGVSINLVAAIHAQSPEKYHARLTWIDSEGREHVEDRHVTL